MISDSTGSSEKVPAKFRCICSVRADRLCIGCPMLVCSKKAGNSNMLFCSTQSYSRSKIEIPIAIVYLELIHTVLYCDAVVISFGG